MRSCIFLSIIFSSLLVFASDKSADLPKRAIEKSQLTFPGSRPFHLKVEIVEATNLENDSYKATLEEYWVAPDKWRRTLKTDEFSQTLVTNGANTQEQITGDYYPNWLRTLVTAILEPGAKLQGVDLSKSSDNPVIGGSEYCRRFSFRAGIPPVGNNVFSTFCFQSDRLASVGIPGFHAEYKDYKKFGDKEVARRVREYIESGTELEARVIELTELTNIDESLFTVSQSNEPLRTVIVSEETMRKLASDPLEIQWPPVRGGKTEGVLSVFVSIDRDGHVRETYDLNSDNPHMSDAARSQLAVLRFKPAEYHGARAQVEGLLTFAFKTKIDDPYPELSDIEARKLAIKSVEPSLSGIPSGTVLTMNVFVGEDGTVHSFGPLTGSNAAKNMVFLGIRDWKFKVLEKNGKPTPFNATLKFVVN